MRLGNKMILDEIKSICIVGNAYTIIGRGLGEKIDQQECVARFSVGVPMFNEKFVKDIGTRTDIYIKRKLMSNKMCLQFINSEKPKAIFTDISAELKSVVRKLEIMTYELSANPRKYRNLRLPRPYLVSKLSSGLAFIGLCMKHKIPEINICGFTTEKNYDPDQPAEFCTEAKKRGQIWDKDMTNKQFDENRNKQGVHSFKTERSIRSRLIKEGKIKLL